MSPCSGEYAVSEEIETGYISGITFKSKKVKNVQTFLKQFHPFGGNEIIDRCKLAGVVGSPVLRFIKPSLSAHLMKALAWFVEPSKSGPTTAYD